MLSWEFLLAMKLSVENEKTPDVLGAFIYENELQLFADCFSLDALGLGKHGTPLAELSGSAGMTSLTFPVA